MKHFGFSSWFLILSVAIFSGFNLSVYADEEGNNNSKIQHDKKSVNDLLEKISHFKGIKDVGDDRQDDCGLNEEVQCPVAVEELVAIANTPLDFQYPETNNIFRKITDLRCGDNQHSSFNEMKIHLAKRALDYCEKQGTLNKVRRVFSSEKNDEKLGGQLCVYMSDCSFALVDVVDALSELQRGIGKK